MNMFPKKSNMKLFVSSIILFALLLCGTSNGQNCNQAYQDANQAYYNGNFASAIELLKSCGEIGSKDQEHLLILLINASLMNTDLDEAETYMKNLLSINPKFKAKPYHSLEFIKLFNSFNLSTKGALGFSAGISIPKVKLLRSQSYASNTLENGTYESYVNAAFGLSGTYNLWKSLFLSSGLYFQQNTYEQSEVILEYQRIRSKETLSSIKIPVQIEWQPLKGSIRPFAAVGPSFQAILRSKADLERFPIQTEIPIPFSGIPFSSDGYKLNEQRKFLLMNWSYSAGTYFRKDTFLFGLRISYDQGLSNIVDASNRYANKELLDVYAFVSDDLILSHFSIMASIQKNFTMPKKNQQ